MLKDQAAHPGSGGHDVLERRQRPASEVPEHDLGPVSRKRVPGDGGKPRLPPLGEGRPLTKSRKYLSLVVAGLVVAGIAYLLLRPAQAPVKQGAGRRGAEAGQVSVMAVAAVTADVPVTLEGVGTARALNTVAVQPQVGGKLISINFKEGEDVKKGELLATIDPTIYQAQLDQALAKKAQDEAQLANQQRDLARFERVGTLAITQQQTDTQRALILQQQALIRADAAAVENTKATLSYTQIVSPLDGRTGIRQIDEGNIVQPNGGSIVSITQVRPIAVLFNLPQQQLSQVNKAFGKGALSVEALAADGKTSLDRGKLTVVNNQVDQATGTVQMKAEFPNADLQLWPGQFVNVRLLVDTLKGATVTPVAAVQRGPNGPFVYTVQNSEGGSRVAVRNITVAQQDDQQAVIASGVAAGERVVTSGFARLQPGALVSVTIADSPSAAPIVIKPDAAAVPPPAPAGPGAAAQPGGTERGKGKGGGRRRDGSGPAAPGATQ